MEGYQNSLSTYGDSMNVGTFELGDITGSDAMCLDLVDINDAALNLLVLN